MEALIAHLKAAYLTVLIRNQTIALCIDAHLSGDVIHLSASRKTFCFINIMRENFLRLVMIIVKYLLLFLRVDFI